jgi:hypothetical protein
MTKNLSLPFWIAILMFSLSSLILAVFPDTRNVVDQQVSIEESGDREPLLHRGDGQPACKPQINFKDHMMRAFRRTQDELYDVRVLFASSKNVSLCLVVFLLSSLAISAYGTIIQYISLRYHWKVAEVRTGYSPPFCHKYAYNC